MKRTLGACLLAAVWACSLFEPDDPGFGSLTGDWEATWSSTFPDGGARWYRLRIVEEPAGDIAGAVVRIDGRPFPTPDSTTYTGTVTGRHKGSDIVLIFTYESGDRHRFEGRQTSRTTFRGEDESLEGWGADAVVVFLRVLGPS